MRKTLIILSLFLLFSILTTNIQARIYDSETEEIVNYQELFTGSPIAGVLSTSNIISYGNTAELVYDSASGLYDEILTISGDSWSRSSTFITNEGRCGRSGYGDYVLIQNNTQVDLFFFNNCISLGAIDYYSSTLIHYYKIKGGSWIRGSNTTLSGGTENFISRDLSCDYSSNGKDIFCNVRATIFGGSSGTQYPPIILKFNESGTTEYWTTTASYGQDYGISRRYGGESIGYFSDISGNYNIFGFFRNSCPAYTASSGFLYADNLLTTDSASASDDCSAEDDGSGDIITGIPSERKNYVFFMRNDSTAFFGFYSSDTLGINCTSSVARGFGTFYFCEDTPLREGYFSFSAWIINVFGKGIAFNGANGYIHYLYFIGSSPTSVMVTHEYQTADTTWKYHNITTLNPTLTSSMGAINISEGTIFAKTESNFLYFYYENETNPLPPTPTPTPSGEMLGLVCGAGSFLTGTTMEGGCLIASLFILAIVLSIIGWILRIMEKEYEIVTQNKYLISGLVSLSLIIGFTVIGMCDIITAIISFFMIVAILIIYEENVVTKS